MQKYSDLPGCTDEFCDQNATREYPPSMFPTKLEDAYSTDMEANAEADWFQMPTVSLWLAWCLLLIAIGFEVAATVCMKLSDGFKRPVPSVLVFVCFGLSFGAFPLALQVIELSTAYAVWSGLGTVLTAVIGIFWFQDTVNATKMLALLSIMCGCIAIKYADGLAEAAQEAAQREKEGIMNMSNHSE